MRRSHHLAWLNLGSARVALAAREILINIRVPLKVPGHCFIRAAGRERHFHTALNERGNEAGYQWAAVTVAAPTVGLQGQQINVHFKSGSLRNELEGIA